MITGRTTDATTTQPVRRYRWIPLALLGSAPSFAHAAQAGPYTIGLEPSYFTGRYGTRHTIHIYDLPLTAAYYRDPIRIRMEVPYLVITGAGIVVGNTIVVSHSAGGVRSGPGDLWFKIEYRINHAAGPVPSFEPYVKVKVPLASYQDGLGTGRFDEEGGVRLTWRATDHVFPYVQLGYRNVGRLPGLHLLNVVTFQPGVAVAITPSTDLTALVIGHTAVQQRRGAVASAIVAYNLRMTRRWELQIYATHGLTVQSPAFGAGIGIRAHF